jgi:dihydropteroate synthase
MQCLAMYQDVVRDVRDELSVQVDGAIRAGVAPEKLVIDPGLGFAKTAAHNWLLCARLGDLVALGYPVLVGASRKSYLGSLLAAPDGTARPVAEREAATVAATVLAIDAGAWGVRVHDVRGNLDAISVWQATRRAAAQGTRGTACDREASR